MFHSIILEMTNVLLPILTQLTIQLMKLHVLNVLQGLVQVDTNRRNVVLKEPCGMEASRLV